MRIVILTPVRLLGEGLLNALHGKDGMNVAAITADLGALRTALKAGIDLALIDVSAGYDADEIRAVAAEHPGLVIVALGVREQREDVIRCGRAGFVAYVTRDASLETLCNAMQAAVAGRLTCPPEIACSLLRELFHAPRLVASRAEPAGDLTVREGDVLRLLGRGFSNKEIARELKIGLGTVKHHVHSVLGKLGVARRTQAMRKVREAPWIA
jgi:DNA-binding NarL/FixJ family response regulator